MFDKADAAVNAAATSIRKVIAMKDHISALATAAALMKGAAA